MKELFRKRSRRRYERRYKRIRGKLLLGLAALGARLLPTLLPTIRKAVSGGKQLTSTGAYKEWSKPVDTVDNAAYHHNLTYKDFTDIAKRDEADKIIVEELGAIKNSTILEKIERSNIKLIISTKANFGLGIQKNFKRSLYSTENEEYSCVVERWNRAMKEKIFKYFSANSTRKYINVLDEMVNKYNLTKDSLQ
ncbi:uncharacterized protein LOC136080422 [Hydra vulgaris]|uniref:Uncharacterized protein LOC136080422 n=1 Tax=Hydra vulgaris TaxID=6087 RepID=A0ABM4BV98_HYDVU